MDNGGPWPSLLGACFCHETVLLDSGLSGCHLLCIRLFLADLALFWGCSCLRPLVQSPAWPHLAGLAFSVSGLGHCQPTDGCLYVFRMNC